MRRRGPGARPCGPTWARRASAGRGCLDACRRTA
jgi:hypothetical protein